MMPPECEICHERFFGAEGGLIYFARDARAQEWHDRQKEEGFVGHPPEAVWFCGTHYPAAQELEHLTRSEAMSQL